MSCQRLIPPLVVLVAFTCGAARSAAQHTGDAWIAVDSNGQLTIDPRSYVPADNFAYLPPVSGLLKGWSDDDPGFDHTVAPDPAMTVFPLNAGAEIWLEVVTVDPAFRAIDDGFQVLDAPGEDTELGGANIHQHMTWHINSQDPAFDPDQCVWHATFILRDDGATGYADSDPLVYSFTNVEVRAAGVAATGDFDASGTLDAADFAALAECLAGPEILPDPADPGVTTCVVECLNAFDFDDDRDVDLADAAAFQRLPS